MGKRKEKWRKQYRPKLSVQKVKFYCLNEGGRESSYMINLMQKVIDLVSFASIFSLYIEQAKCRRDIKMSLNKEYTSFIGTCISNNILLSLLVRQERLLIYLTLEFVVYIVQSINYTSTINYLSRLYESSK